MTTGESRESSRSSTSICTSIFGRTCPELAEKARTAFEYGTDLVEFRLDYLRSQSFDEIKTGLEEFIERSVLTVRPRAEGGRFRRSEPERLDLIRSLVELKAPFVDVELKTVEGDHGLSLTKKEGHLIVSWHDWSGTPDRLRLLSVLRRAAAFGIPKIVTAARAAEDNLSVLSLYDDRRRPSPIAFCMGEKGTLSRVMAIERGSPICYASLPGEPTAPGQLVVSQAVAIRRLLQGD